ncbi:hypothetical protein ACZ91_58785 [Streptomyces regensis]|nr:hypothetical protein ACZ91_58785 [Streptomyces regensis]
MVPPRLTTVIRPLRGVLAARPCPTVLRGVLTAARTGVIPPVGRATFARVAAVHRGPMDAGQRALASSFVLSE